MEFPDRLSEMDTFFLRIERDPRLHSTITLLALLDHTPDPDRIRRSFEAATHRVPRLTQRIAPSPLRITPPLWEYDPDFDLARHLRWIDAPGDGTVRDLLDHVGSIAHMPLDRPPVRCRRPRPRESWARDRGGTMSGLLSAVGASRPNAVPLRQTRSGNARLYLADVAFDALRAAAAEVDCKMNDAIIAAIVVGLHRWQEDHGSPPSDLAAQVPVSIRSGDTKVAGNEIVAARTSIRLGASPALVRSTRDQVATARSDPLTNALGPAAWTLNRLPESAAPFFALAMGAGADLVASNVRGPRRQIYLGSVPVSGTYGLGPLSGVPLNITVLSYAGQACVGISADTDAVPDAEDLAARIAASFRELTRAA